MHSQPPKSPKGEKIRGDLSLVFPLNPPVKGGKKPPSLPSPLIMGGFRGVQGDFGNFAKVGVIGNVYLFL